jgi:putative MATE family efflux protein
MTYLTGDLRGRTIDIGRYTNAYPLPPMTHSGAGKSNLLSITWPIFIEQALRMMIGIVDTLIVSHVSDDAVAALGVANQIVIFFVISFNFVGIGSSVVITHYLGAKDGKGAAVIAKNAVAVNTWLGVAASAFVLFAAPALLTGMSLPVHLMHYARPFLLLMGGTLFLEAFCTSIAGVLRAYKFTRDAMYVALGQNVINLVGSAILIFGWFGAPQLGVVGVAAASVFSRCCSCLALVFVLGLRTQLHLRAADFVRIAWRKVYEVLRIGLPAAAENICYWSAFMCVTRFVAQMGGDHLAVQQYTMQIQRVVIMFSISIGLGTEILVGHHVGAGRLEDAFRELMTSLRKGLLLALGLVGVVALMAPYILRMFTQDQHIIDASVLLLRISIVLETGRVFNVVVISSLRATGDVRFPIQAGVLSMWCVWVPLAWLASHMGFGMVGIWLAMCVDEWFRGLMMYRRWKLRRWVPHAERSRAQVLAMEQQVL